LRACCCRACCNEWFGHKLFEAGRFQPECPLCRHVDESLQPSEAALAALQEIQQYYSQEGEGQASEQEGQASEEEGQSEVGPSEDHEAELECEDGLEDTCEDDSDGSDDGADIREEVSGSSSSNDDASSSEADDGMEVDSDAGSFIASSALTAVTDAT
jgi:hypothetical protein